MRRLSLPMRVTQHPKFLHHQNVRLESRAIILNADEIHEPPCPMSRTDIDAGPSEALGSMVTATTTSPKAACQVFEVLRESRLSIGTLALDPTKLVAAIAVHPHLQAYRSIWWASCKGHRLHAPPTSCPPQSQTEISASS